MIEERTRAKRIVLAAVAAGGWALAVYLGARLYRAHVLGAPQATRLSRSDYLSLPVGSFKHFYEPKPDTVINDAPDWLPQGVAYTINRDGLNERFDYPAEKPPGAFRIITLGDSFTFGQFVNTSQNYSELLEDRLNATARCRTPTRFEVINLGVGGYDVGYAVQRFSLRGVPYHPDLVVWFINPHNLLQLQDMITVRQQEIRRSMSAVERAERRRKGDYHYAAAEATREITAEFGKKAILERQSAYLDAFSKIYGGPLVVVCNGGMEDPDLRAVIERFVRGRPNTWVFRGLSDLKKIQGAFPDDHPNAYGHSVIAAQILAYLKTLSVYPCGEVRR